MMSIRILCVLLTLSGAALADDTAALRADNIPDRETANYVSDITEAIQRQIYDANRYKGKECSLSVKIDRDGNILGAKAEQGDKELCQRALKILGYTKLPKPPSDEIWSRIQNVTLIFRP
ncbi:cell envelope integrity protein TolA [Klebsiella pneumoniae]|uniref:cell envelope integrity protein TolA n=1 Tax=Enterobacteriaceae TaxID=543 RepID=UPI001237C01D|nr:MULTISPECIES: cell envelope integrity protein TolA [Enterobacteriaceae]KAA5796359.1 cell envelope integrity protein TolA [Klebsiella pneumoniae]MBL1868922.1 cell envelope integrity protein TolA [Klebsiella pneumoniae]MBZ1405039.1 cell envelope integrity protein TolA [Escherichia coli]MDS7813968.1 cell envelope integrity protein TolA [Klebsiella michiganensis]